MTPYLGRLPAVDSSKLRKHLDSLAVVRNQILNPLAIRNVSRYITDHFTAAGLVVRSEAFYSVPTAWKRQHNLIGTLVPGRGQAEPPRVIIGAHYDAVPFSPGADDNASGVAVLLEVADACAKAGAPVQRPVDFIAFGMEEEGCVGSGRHATRLARTGARIAGMISLECVGYTDDRPGTQIVPPGLSIEVPDRGTFLGIIGNGISSELVELMEASARAHAPGLPTVGLVVEENGRRLPAARLSDHAPFWDRGYPALMLTDTAFLRNPNYHRPSDLPETLDFGFMADVARAVAAFTLALAL